ncbi:hypothetical protein GCM10009789_11880 [Kribbella sancticallisti]|uniref:3-oxoacyl-[acyl-carrier protein] reductase n=1 Tax=Kribbella sancticallisti TaxID=460087 RepID=A0ABN2CKM0_9ACTN
MEAIRAAGGEADGFTADLADPELIPALVHGIERVFGQIDILVNHAATVAPLGPVTTLDPAAVLRALTLNVASAVALAGAVIPPMTRQGWGRIANVCSSVGHLVSWPGGNVYAACVAALDAHSVNLAEELAGTGITVNVLRAQWAGTALRTWLAGIDPDAVDDPLIRRFVLHQTGLGTVDSDRSAATLLDHLVTTQTGRVWSAAPTD